MSRTQEELDALLQAATAAMIAAYQADASSFEIRIEADPVDFAQPWETMIEPDPVRVKITTTPHGNGKTQPAGYYFSTKITQEGSPE